MIQQVCIIIWSVCGVDISAEANGQDSIEGLAVFMDNLCCITGVVKIRPLVEVDSLNHIRSMAHGELVFRAAT